MLHVNGGMIYG